MSTHVRVRKHEDFVRAVDRFGMQTEVAQASGVSIQRVNQLYSGRHNVIDVQKAAILEDTLGVSRGQLFAADHGALLADYLGPAPEPEPYEQPALVEPGPDAPEGAPEDAPEGPNESPRPDECAAPGGSVSEALSAQTAA